jgi:hypothetical protein
MRVMTRKVLTVLGTLLIAAATAFPSFAAGSVNRWGLDYNRVTRQPRASDPYVHKPPVRIYRKPKPLPDVEIPPLPRYGKPKPALERIPET